MESNYHYIARDVFERMFQSIDLLNLSENNSSEKFIFNGNPIVFTSFVVGCDNVCFQINAHKAISIDQYKGDLVPLFSNEHYQDFRKGNRTGSFSGRKVIIEGEIFVLIEPELNFILAERKLK